MGRVLNVGGGSVSIPRDYQGWDVDLLDIDPEVKPDICMDARQMTLLAPGRYDVIYASHVIEHFAEHEVADVLWGFYHVLTWTGYADIRCPDAKAVMLTVAAQGLDMDSVLYQAPVGPIRVGDVLWGWQRQIKRSHEPFYAHRWGFSRDTLGRALREAHFEYIEIGGGHYELRAKAWKRKPKEGE